MKKLGVILLLLFFATTACKKSTCPAYGDLHSTTDKNGKLKKSKVKSGLAPKNKKLW